MTEYVEVKRSVNGTSGTLRLTADKVVESQMFTPHPDGGAISILVLDDGHLPTDGPDDAPITIVHIAQAYQIIRRAR